MTYTTPPTFVAGDPLAAADLNILGEDIEDLKAIADGVTFSGVQVKRNTARTINTATWTTITWQTETGGFDIGGWWSSGANIEVPAGAIPAGFTTIAVDVLARTNFASNGTGTRYIRVRLNGVVTETYSIGAISGDPTEVACPDTIVVAAGDIITAQVYQNSGGDLDISATNTKFTILRRAPVA